MKIIFLFLVNGFKDNYLGCNDMKDIEIWGHM